VSQKLFSSQTGKAASSSAGKDPFGSQVDPTPSPATGTVSLDINGDTLLPSLPSDAIVDTSTWSNAPSAGAAPASIDHAILGTAAVMNGGTLVQSSATAVHEGACVACICRDGDLHNLSKAELAATKERLWDLLQQVILQEARGEGGSC
jgi:hypothetical protein